MTSRRAPTGHAPRRAIRFARLAALALCGLTAGALPAAAQFSWPWDQPQQRKPVEQPPPVWRPPPEPSARPAPAAPPVAAGGRSPVCLQLEQRLVQETQNGGQSRDILPMVEGQLRQLDQQLRQSSQTLDRSCYEYFLFSKTLRNTKKCIDLSREVEGMKRQKADLENQRSQLIASSGRSYTDEIVRELARNNCGATYQQQARRSEQNPFQSLWQEDSGGSGGGGLGGSFSNLPYATYRTVCVRLCDGYYFPVSFSTLPNHFERDAEVCTSKCAAPTELFYYQNPGGSVEQMVGAQSNTPYSSMKTAFRYRKEYVQGCSCKAEEYNAGTPATGDAVQQQGAVTPPPASPAPAATASGGTGTAASGWTSETVTTP